jgi:hypothetical protein
MATQTESAPRPNKSRTNSHGQNAEAQPEIDSSVVMKETRKDVEPLTDEQRRELIAAIWREIYGPSPSTTSLTDRSTVSAQTSLASIDKRARGESPPHLEKERQWQCKRS